MPLRCCILLVCFAQEIFGYRNCSMSLILLYWWIISEPGNTNCFGSYSFNLCFVLVEKTSLLFPSAISPLLSLPSHQSQLMVFPCNILAINSFSPLPVLLVFRVDSASSSAHIAVRALAHLPSSGQHWWQTPCQPPGSGTAASLAFLMLICSSASPSPCAMWSWCASRMQEGSAGVRPSSIPHRGTWHTGGSSTSFCLLPRP